VRLSWAGITTETLGSGLNGLSHLSLRNGLGVAFAEVLGNPGAPLHAAAHGSVQECSVQRLEQIRVGVLLLAGFTGCRPA